MRDRPERTTRIALRCTPKEHEVITKLASKYKLSVAEFVRQAILISVTMAPKPIRWRILHERARSAFYIEPE